MDYLSRNMVWLRAAKGITQEQVAKALGVSQGTVSRFEKGKIGSLKHRQVMQLSELFEVSVGDLVQHDFAAGAPTAKTSQAEFDLEALKSALVSFDKTLKALKVPYDHMQYMARTLRFAYDYLAERPEMTKMEREAFDLALIQKMTEDINAAPTGDGSRTATGDRGRAKGAEAQP